MRIGCLQFAPQVGDINNNLNRADAVLSRASLTDLEDLDLLVLPELAFTGYNFKSLQQISPFLEPPGSGISSLWARTTALKYNCHVVVGYPEKVDVSRRWPTSPEYYNSAIVINNDGETVANYRKNFLYYTDETWALESKDGFFGAKIPGLGRTALGICMDINPYKFEAPWRAFEFALHVLKVKANLVIVSMAWLTREDSHLYSRRPHEPDLDTLVYWVQRLEPVITAEKGQEVIVVFCNRTGIEGDAVYSGTSAVIGIKEGEVSIYGLLGRGVKELLVVDTSNPPFSRLVMGVEAVPYQNSTWHLIPVSPEEGNQDDEDDNGASFSMLSPDTPVAISLFDQRVIPEEDPLSPGMPPKSFSSLMAPLSPRGGDAALVPETPIEVDGIVAATTIVDDMTIETPIDDDVIIETPITPYPAIEHFKPKLVIPTSRETGNYKTSPYPWQQQRPGKSMIFGGDVAVSADPTSPTTPFELDEGSAISIPTGSSVSYRSALLSTPDDESDLTPLSPASAEMAWEQPSIASALSGLRREEATTQSIDKILEETLSSGKPDAVKPTSSGQDFGERTEKQEKEIDSAEMIEITRALQKFIVGAARSPKEQGDADAAWADQEMESLLDRPQSPKSRNASQTRGGGLNDGPIDPQFAERRLSLSRNSTPEAIGREIEAWRPRSNPIVTGRSSTKKGHRIDERARAEPANVRSRSLSGLDDRMERRRGGLNITSGVYTSGVLQNKRPQSQARQHKAITPRGVRRSFDGPQMRRVSRGRQPRGRSPGLSGHERSNSVGSSTLSGGPRRAWTTEPQRAASLMPPPPPPLVDGMVVLNSAPRSRSFSRTRHASGDDIVVDISLVAPHCPLHGCNSPRINGRWSSTASEGGNRRTSLSRTFSVEDFDADADVIQRQKSEGLVTPQDARPAINAPIGVENGQDGAAAGPYDWAAGAPESI